MPKANHESKCETPCFITTLTKDRQPIFSDRKNIILFLQTLKEVQAVKHARVLSYAILPDHIHMIVQSVKSSASQIMHSLKLNFTKNWKLISDDKTENIGANNFWQPRFWHHEIKNDQDLYYHINYIIMNPVKHGYVDDPEDWPYSSFAKNIITNDLGFDGVELAV